MDDVSDESLNEPNIPDFYPPNRRSSGSVRPCSSSDIYSSVEEEESRAPYSFREIRSRVEERSRAENRSRAEDRSRIEDRLKADRSRAEERSRVEDRSRLENCSVMEEDDLPRSADRPVPPAEPYLKNGQRAAEGEPYLTQTTV